MSMKKIVIMMLVLVLALTIVGCSDDSDDLVVGNISGVIQGNSGSPLADVEVSVGGKSDITDSNGAFEIEDIDGGSATIKAEKSGVEFLNRSIVVDEGDNQENLEVYLFRPEEDYNYPLSFLVIDFDDEGILYLIGDMNRWNNNNNDYKLRRVEDNGSDIWIGDFSLQRGIEYRIDDGADGYIPWVADEDLLIAGREHEDGEYGSYSYAANQDNAFWTYIIATMISSDQRSGGWIESSFTSNSIINWEGNSKEINEIVTILADREADYNSRLLRWDFEYGNSFKGVATLDEKTKGHRREEFSLTYTDEGWKIEEFSSVDANAFTVEMNDDGTYVIEFDLDKAMKTNLDFEGSSPDNYKDIIIASFFNEWGETNDYYEEVKFEQLNEYIWSLEIKDNNFIKELNSDNDSLGVFKLVAITNDGKLHYAPSGFGGERTLDEWVKLSN